MENFFEKVLRINFHRIWIGIHSLHYSLRIGCVKELSKDEIIKCKDINNASCKICSGNTCNFKDELYKCLTCHSQTDPNCVANIKSVEVKVCPDYNDNKCYTIINDDKTVQRGCCGPDKNFQKKFSQHENPQCEICVNRLKNACNDNELLDTCIECDSNTDPLCRNQPEQIKESVCTVKPLIDSHGCYLNSSSEEIKRGCFEDLELLQGFECRRKSGQCQRCIGKNCNKKVTFQQKCHICNGTENPSCAEAKTNNTVLCQNYGSSCFVGIDGNGFTHRGCITPKLASDGPNLFDGEYFQKGFKICYDNLCNGLVMPENRFECYQCQGEKCKNFKESSKICNIFSENDECFAYMSAGILVAFFAKKSNTISN